MLTMGRVRRPFRKAKRLTERIESVLSEARGKIDIEISDVVPGGSATYGTAIPGHFDLDITILSSSLHPKHAGSGSMEPLYRRGLEQIMEYLKASLTQHYRIQNVQELYGNHGRRFQSWHFQVDLTLSVKWDSMDDMCTYLKPLPQQERKLLSMGATKYHNELLSEQPHRVKILIKRFKAWRNDEWPPGSPTGGYPKSILLSFLVLISYKRAPEEYKRAQGLKTLAIWMAEDLQRLVCEQIRFDATLDLIVPVPGQSPLITMEKYRDCLPDKPRIQDPANPFKNLYRQGLGETGARGGDDIPERWEIFATKIKTLNLVMNLT